MYQIKYQMKKIISSVFLTTLIVTSCTNKKTDENTKTIQEAPITQVVGIGKVLPKGGIVELSLTQSNKVIKLYKQVGDTVRNGDVIFEMESVGEKLQVEQAKAALQTANKNYNANQYDIRLAELKLASLKKEYETSKQLYKKKAETGQKVFQDSIAYREQLAIVKQQKEILQAEASGLNEKKVAIKSSQLAVSNQSFKAIQEGILVRFDVALGSILPANFSFGDLAPLTDLVVEGELDELYANQIKLGQKVSLVLVGQTSEIASGKIIFVGTSLQNKSIIYETVGEASDRRVRRFTVQIEKGQQSLLINQKVECKIIL